MPRSLTSAPLESAIRLFIMVLAFSFPSLLHAQADVSTPPPKLQASLAQHPDWPKANPSDVATIEDTVRAFFNAISAPAAGKLNRDRLHSLFVPDGRIAVGLPARPGRAADILFMTPDEYADRSDAATLKSGFFDRNLANQIERFGVMAHVYSTYESRTHPNDKIPMARGIKSFELLNSANRLYIVQIYWDSERPDNLIPMRYLHGSSEGVDEQPKGR